MLQNQRNTQLTTYEYVRPTIQSDVQKIKDVQSLVSLSLKARL